MKQTTVQISFEAEKLNALKQFMGLKDADLTAELNGLMDRLYEKYVPHSVRLYIDGRPEEEPPRPPRRPRPAKKAAEPPAAPVNQANPLVPPVAPPAAPVCHSPAQETP